MKTRLGFVSNSSSASYYIKLTGTSNEIVQDIVEACGYLTWGSPDHGLALMLRENIKRLETTITKLEQGMETWLLESKKELEKRKKKLEKDLDYITNESYWNNLEKFTAICLDVCGITKKTHETCVELEYFTSMHNSYTDGMHPILQELVLMSKFNETNSTIDVDIKKDG